MAKPIPKRNIQQTVTMDQMLKNPLGKYSANVIRRSFARSGMQTFYLNLLKKYRFAISVQGYKVDNRIFFIVMIPSEAYEWNKVRYTVIIEFMGDRNSNRPFIHRDMKYYSNSPAYQFIYEYVLYHRGLIPDTLTPLLSDIAISNAPVVRNPDQTLGWEKSLYAAGRILSENAYLTHSYINSNRMKPLSTSQWQTMISNVPSSDDLIKVLEAGRRVKASKNPNARKPLTKEGVKQANQMINTNKVKVIDKKSKLQKKAKLSVKTARSKKNKYNVR